MPAHYKNATEQQFQDWERLLDQGVPRFEASRQVGTTLRRLRLADEVRFFQGVELSQERQAAQVEKLIVDQTERPEPSPQLLALRAKATHPDYEDKSKVEISGPDGGPISVEGRAVVGLAEFSAFVRSIGYEHLFRLPAGDSRDALPAAQEVLPDARDGKRAAELLPPARPA